MLRYVKEIKRRKHQPFSLQRSTLIRELAIVGLPAPAISEKYDAPTSATTDKNNHEPAPSGSTDTGNGNDSAVPSQADSVLDTLSPLLVNLFTDYSVYRRGIWHRRRDVAEMLSGISREKNHTLKILDDLKSMERDKEF
ncbi:hypothetical protein [Parasitella parasitica]|uniref:Uncharacterized protein n=1 Tax=Parasitella parasitica TaxID=35722 RepID=A0A0B7N9N7_9FUNG|nr:hypothetical protein [Parasitella parasitica]